MYFSANVKHPYKLKIFKLLYFLDFYHIKQKGVPVTNLKYYAWEMGPVPKDLYYEIKNGLLPDANESIKIIPKQLSDDKEAYEFKAKKPININIFTPREKQIMDNLIYIFKDATAKDMSEITHLKNTPWYKTRKEKGDGEFIDYELAIDYESTIKMEDAIIKITEREEIRNNFLMDDCIQMTI